MRLSMKALLPRPEGMPEEPERAPRPRREEGNGESRERRPARGGRGRR